MTDNRVIAREGTEVVEAVYALPDSLDWTEPLAIVIENDGEVYGEATNIQRGKDGQITADVSFHTEHPFITGEEDLRVHLVDVEAQRNEGEPHRRDVSKATIKELCVVHPDESEEDMVEVADAVTPEQASAARGLETNPAWHQAPGREGFGRD